MEQDAIARPDPIACPICGQVLKRTTAHWLAAFDCDRCGQFSDFGDASLSPAGSRHTPRLQRNRLGFPS
jgi:hypothetical protein